MTQPADSIAPFFLLHRHTPKCTVQLSGLALGDGMAPSERKERMERAKKYGWTIHG